MSYILDALQRAEAERERGRVPGLKSQLVPPVGRHRASAHGLRTWHVLAGAGALLIALGVWWWTAMADAPVVVITEAPVAASPAEAGAPQPSAPETPPQSIAQPAQPVLPILAPPRAAPAAAPVAAADKAAPAPGAASGNTAPTAATPAPPPTSAPVPSFGELTPDARAQLPAVNVSGSTYSQNAALRMLIANGKVVQEGQEIAPGLRLETIGPRSAVLNHQGLRYSIGY